MNSCLFYKQEDFWVSGYYMYIETSSPRRNGDKARLISPFYPPTMGRCLTFYYHMYGSGIGALNVYLKQQGVLKPPIFATSGDHGNVWNPQQLTLNSNTPFQVKHGSICERYCISHTKEYYY